MATTKSASEYITDAAQKITETATTVTDSVGSGASQDIVAQGNDLTKNWSIGGASNENIKNISTGSGNDEINFTSSVGGANVNVGTGKDSVIIGTGGFTNTSLVGGEGDKVIQIAGKLDPSYISIVGSGNNLFSIGTSAEDSTIVSGAGRDSVEIGTSVASSVINTGAGNDIVTIGGVADTTTIDLGDGRDSMSVTGIVKDSTIDGGAGADVITLTSGASNSKISLGAGKDTLEVSAAIIDTSIYGGADADQITLTGATYSSVDLGDGNDTISVNGAGYADFSVAGGAGKDRFDTSNFTGGTVTITDYDVLNDVIVDTVVGGAGFDANGNITLSTTGTVNVSKTGEYYAAQIEVAGATNYYVWGDDDGSWIDVSSFNKSVTANGGVNGDVADTIVGGKKADVINLSANDYGYGGAGNDTINIVGAGTQEFVGIADAAGRDTVTAGSFQSNTTTGDAETADVLYAFGTNLNNVKLDTVTGGMIAKVGTGSVELVGLAAGNDEKINIKDNSGRTYEVDFVTGTASVTGAADELADVYYAGTSAASLDFSSINDALVVDMGNRKMTVNGTELDNTDSAVYYGSFASVTGGADNTVLMGAADAKETLIAGAGDTTLWGGGSKSDYMQHTGTTNTATFFFTSGDGKDTISSNNWAASETSDVLWLGSTAIKSVKNSGTNTTVTLDDGSKVTLSGLSATDTAFKFSTDGVNTQQVKVGTSGSNTWTYDEGVTYYMGGTKNTLNVSDDANIWLDGSNGKAFQNVTTVNAASSSGTVILAGTAANETLIAGTGESSLWGGAGNDVLQGNNTGSTTFYFGNGNGKDVITASNSDDKVVLYNANLTDVKSADVTKSGAMEIQLKDGSSLTVNGISSGASTFQLADGSTWKYDSSEGWKQA